MAWLRPRILLVVLAACTAIGAGLLGTLSLFLLRARWEARTAAPQALHSPPFEVGYDTLRFAYPLPDGSSRELTVAIWYPTRTTPAPYAYNRVVLPGRVAVGGDRPAQGEPFPLIVFSHGYLGCGTQSTYLTQYLAGQGYVVAAPDHEDAKLCSIVGAPGPGELWRRDRPPIATFQHRPGDIQAVIDELLRLSTDRQSNLFAMIDPQRIGAAGHSLGGWTVAVASGAIPQLRDGRISAALLLAPAESGLTAEDFGRITAPVMFLLGERELPILGSSAERATSYENARPPKFRAVVEDAGHFAFDDTICSGYRDLESCIETNARAGVVLRYATAFFDYFVRNDESGPDQLLSGDPRLVSYDYALR